MLSSRCDVADLEASVAFYSKLFGVEPAKRRPGYANFAITEPAAQARPRSRASRARRPAWTTSASRSTPPTRSPPPPARLKDAGLATFEENDTSCCYALQDKVWVHGPGKEPWEVYVVKADADRMGKAAVLEGEGCCAGQGGTAEPEAPAS